MHREAPACELKPGDYVETLVNFNYFGPPGIPAGAVGIYRFTNDVSFFVEIGGHEYGYKRHELRKLNTTLT